MTFEDLHTLIYDNYSRKQLEYLDRQYIATILSQEEKAKLPKEMKEVYADMTTFRSGVNLSPQKRTAGLLSIIFYVEPLFRLWEQSLSEDAQRLLQALVLHASLSEQVIREEMGIEVKKPKQSFATQSLLLPEFLAFPHKTEYQWSPGLGSDNHYVFSFPRELRLFLAQYVELPDKFSLQPVASPSQGRFSYQDEGSIFAELPMIRLYDQNGDIKMSKRDRPLASTFNPMRKKLGLREFFPLGKKPLQSLRTAILTHFWKAIYQDEWDELEGLDLLSALMKSYWKDRLDLGNLLLHLQGQHSMPTYYRANVSKSMETLLSALPQDAWVEIDNIIGWAQFQGLPLASVSETVAQGSLFFKDQQGRKVMISPGLYHKMIELPSIYASCFLFAALGLLDIRYDEPDISVLGKTWFSPFDGLKHIRLTELGAFLVGRQEAYKPPAIVEQASFSLSATQLQVLVLNGANPARLSVLGRLGRQLSSRRYEIDAASFLASCQTRQDLERTIGLFRQNIIEQPPQIWEDFFDKLRNNTQLLQQRKGLIVYVLPDNRELIRLVVQDPQLKRLSIKAEQYHLLVEEDDHELFVTRLKELGYLV